MERLHYVIIFIIMKLYFLGLYEKILFDGFVAQRFHNYMILKVFIVFDPKLNLFKSDAYIFMQQSPV